MQTAELAQHDINFAPSHSLTVDEFCAKHNISRTKFFSLQTSGFGPKLMRLGKMIRITPASEKKWIAARERPTDAELRLLEREAKNRSKRASKAGKIGAKSPKHVSNLRRKPSTPALR